MNTFEKYLNIHVQNARVVRVSTINKLYTIQYEFEDTKHGGWVTVLKKDLLQFERREKIKELLETW